MRQNFFNSNFSVVFNLFFLVVYSPFPHFSHTRWIKIRGDLVAISFAILSNNNYKDN